MTAQNTHSNHVDSSWRVMKFGGTSVSSAARWRTIAQQVLRARGDGCRVLVVVSALKGVTDRLEALAAGDQGQRVTAILSALRHEHEALLNRLSLAPDMAFERAWQALLADLREPLDDPAAHSAQLQARGEDLSAALGAQILTQLAEPCCYSASLELLACDPALSQGPLSAYCDASVDRDLAQRLAALGPLHITQGFQVAGPDGRPWLLGRGGSDTSAALLAARLEAQELEIWTDVPGVFSADPAQVPEARLLRQLSYSEAQEFAAMGAKVLHPPCIAPLKAHGIRLSIRDTGQPQAQHTLVGPRSADTEGLIKGVISRRNITLISMESPSMWHQPGFLAEAFGLFKRHGLSVDLISTSESSVTISLDPLRPGHSMTAELDACLHALSQLCTVQLRNNCVAVSLVGNAIRTLLGRLGDAFDLFQDRTVHMVTQSANDLNFTVVVDAAQSDRLVQSLHAKLISATAGQHEAFGPSWSTLKATPVAQPPPWWERRRADLLALAQAGPAYVYHLPEIRQAARRLQSLRSIDRVLYAMKANDHPAVLRALYAEGVSFECVSPGEVAHVLREVPGLDPQRLLCTPNFASREDYEAVLANGVQLTIDSLYPLQAWPDLLQGRSLFLRLDLGSGHGHHRKVVTMGEASKFGIPLHQIPAVLELVQRLNIRVTGLHAHSGSGVRDPSVWAQQLEQFLPLLKDFPEVRVIDLGGGLGVPERRDEAPFDLSRLDDLLLALDLPEQVSLWLEPGRYLVSEAGVLLARVTQTKAKAQYAYLGADVGMNSLLRPALYGAFHDMVNLSRPQLPSTECYTVVGPICESGDVLGEQRYLPPSEEGDVLLIANAGAYGRVMASHYNRREPARELILDAPSAPDA